MSTKLGYFLCLKLANWSEHTTFAIVIQKKKKSQELNFWNYSLVHIKHKCPNHTQPTHTMTHKHLCSHECVQIYLKITDSYVYYCQGAASSKTLCSDTERAAKQDLGSSLFQTFSRCLSPIRINWKTTRY